MTRKAVAGAILLVAGAFAQTPSPDFAFFKTRVQPIFLAKRPQHARCYACHSQGTSFRLERLSPGATAWSDEQSRRNFEAALNFIVPGDLKSSRLLTHPLAPEAGGDDFHSGGKHWNSQSDAEWQVLADWVRGKR